ncbi:hypothetical protein F5Y05DRAFT_409680 [Hypoxylon sp. FL0543]|nr:hypothetical protein F5Y05DRAFT_409680 [Hypoxylon sp. FL0543]
MAPAGGQGLSTALNPNAKTSSDRQVAASNSTLHTWVGGRQPSWLANAKPVKPSPRPSQPSKRPITTESTPPIVTTAQPASVPITAPGTTATTQTTAPPPQPRSPSQPQRPSLQTKQTSTSAAHLVLPSPAPSDEPSPKTIESQSASSTTQARFELNSSIDEPRDKEAQIRVSTIRARTSTRQDKEISVSPTTSIPANMALNTPPTPNMPLINTPRAPNIAPREQVEQPSVKRRCVENTSLRLIQDLGAAQRLHNRVQSIGGEQNLDLEIELPRYRLLGQACAQGDLFFLVLHQLFCLWTINRPVVHRLCYEWMPHLSVVDSAFGMMGTLLKSNTKLRLEHLQFFAEFPFLMASLHQFPVYPVYKATEKQVFGFLLRLGLKWIAIHQEHQIKGYPVLMSELLDGLELYSPILQAILFRASKRSLGIAHGHVAVQVEALFRSDQRHHRNADGSYTRRPPSVEYQAYNNNLIRGYKALVAQHQAEQNAHQGGQQPTPSKAPTMQQPGLSYPPHMYSQRNPQMPQHGGQASRSLPNPPTLRSNSASEGSPGNQFLQYQSPIGTPLSAASPSPVSEGAFFQVPATTQFPMPSNNHVITNSPTMTTPLPSTLHSQLVNSNVQTTLNHQPSLEHLPPVLKQRLQMQRAAHMAPSTQPTPHPTGLYQGHVQPMQPARQWPQGLQNISSQPGQTQQSVPSSGVNNTGLAANPNAVSTHSPPLNLANHLRGSNDHLRESFGSQSNQRSVPPNSHDQLIPAPGTRIGTHEYPHSQYDRRSVESSLHQAHLRSPKRMPREIGSTSPERYYQAVKSFALFPVRIPPQPVLHRFKFTVTDPDHARITRDEQRPGDTLPVNRFSNGSLRFRVRCCFRTKSSAPFSESTWVTTDTSWPEHIFMELNRNTLSVMRKAHHAKDLPVEASPYIVPGDNFLNVYVPQGTSIPHNKEPCIAVEVVEVLSHQAILQMVNTQGRVPASVTQDIVKSRLHGSSSKETDGDELTMVDDLSIDVTDPFSKKMFKVPVRGQTCTHLECFDLETWLNTRLGKRSCYCTSNAPCGNCPIEPSFVDKWRCPLCDGDARPYSLRLDGFLVDVRSQLEKENKLRTKSILVSADGTWNPKEELGDDDSDIGSDEDTNAPVEKKTSSSSTTPFSRDRSTIEVIELD